MTAWTRPVDGEVAKHRGAHIVELPDTVVDHLEVPCPPSRPGVEGDEAVREEVVARTEAAPHGTAVRREGDVYVAELMVRSQAAPRSEVTREAPGVVAPRLCPVLSFPGHNMEGPKELAGPYVVARDVLRLPLHHQRAVAGPTPEPCNHDHITHHDGAGPPTEAEGVGSLPRQVYSSALADAEATGRLPRDRVQCVEVFTAHRDDAPVPTVAPVLDASGALSTDLFRGARGLPPDRPAGGGIPGLHQAHGVGRVHHAVDQNRGGLVVVVGPQVRVAPCERRVETRAPPHDLEAPHVAGVDLVQRRVPLERVSGVVCPPLLGSRRHSACGKKTEGQSRDGTKVRAQHVISPLRRWTASIYRGNPSRATTFWRMIQLGYLI